jgi:uncharacterized membrane protein
MRVGETTDAMRPSLGLKLMSVVMILLGIAKVLTCLHHQFSLIETPGSAWTTAAAVPAGACYIAAGGLLLAARQQTARIALILMILVVVGRIGWLMANLFPIGTSTQVMDIAANTVLALGFTIILAVKLPSISE